LRIVALLGVALALTACAAQPHTIYLRADGQDMASDPVLRQQFDTDRTICQGEQQKASLAGKMLAGQGAFLISDAANRSEAAAQVGQGCMAAKGYVLVPEDQAAAKQQELAAVAAEKARREAAAAAPPPPPVAPQHAALKPKPKPKPQPAQVQPTPQPPPVQPTFWPPPVQPTPQPPPS